MNQLRVLFFIFLFAGIIFSQPDKDWQSFVALETPRTEVERVLGRPVKLFPAYGLYETKFGEFRVWYSTGNCQKNRKGLQYKVGPQLLTRLEVDLPKDFELKDLVWDVESFTKYKPRSNDDRVYYTSLDESLGFMIGRRDDGTEFLGTATIEPGKNKAGSLCEEHNDNNSWRGLKPLKTSRVQVEETLGKPMAHSVNPYAAGYETEAGRVSVVYSRGSCKSEGNSGWDVPELTVIDIKFYPKTPPKFADLTLDLKKFQKRAESGTLGLDEYSNYADGVALTVDREEGTVTSFSYFPDQRDKKRICSK